MRHSSTTCSGTTTEITSTSHPSPGAVDESDLIVEVSVESGPECAGKLSLATGRHVIGRSHSAQIRISDGSLGLHHAIIDIEQGSVTLTQLSGQAPIRIDGEPIIGSRTAAVPVRLSIGMHDVQINPASTTDRHAMTTATGRVAAMPDDSGTRIVWRGPDRAMTPPTEPILAPRPADVERARAATASICVAFGLLCAGMIAGLLGQTVFLLVATLGAAATVATWLAGAVATGRRNGTSGRLAEDDRRRFLRDLAAARAEERQRHLIAHVDLGQIIAIAEGLAGAASVQSDIWQRRLADVRLADVRDGDVRDGDVRDGDVRDGDVRDGDVRGADVTFRPVIGIGTSRWSPSVVGDLCSDSITDIDRAATIDDVPIPISLTCGSLTAISGGRRVRDALVRSILCQMAVRHGPVDWQLVIVSSARAAWEWAGGFPHVHTSNGTILIADPMDPDDLATVLMLACGPAPPPTLLVVEDPALFAVQAGAVQWFVERAQPATLTTIDVGDPAPAGCTALIEIGSTGAVMTARLDGSTDDLADAASAIRMSGLSTECGASIARSLVGLVDPEIDGCSAAR